MTGLQCVSCKDWKRRSQITGRKYYPMCHGCYDSFKKERRLSKILTRKYPKRKRTNDILVKATSRKSNRLCLNFNNDDLFGEIELQKVDSFLPRGVNSLSTKLLDSTTSTNCILFTFSFT